MIGKGQDFRPFFCFDKSEVVDMYALFPGQMIYVALYHPTKALEPKTLSGRAFFKMNFRLKVSQTLSSSKCQKLDVQDITAVIGAHRKHEQW